mgnify:FL=1
MDRVSKETRSNIMRSIKGKDTKIEVRLAKALWHKGLRYRKNNKKVKGKPDICFANKKLAIFVDGEFWHGYEWKERKKKLKTNREFWINKIERNMERDRETNEYLINEGWSVMRFWGKDINERLDHCVEKICEAHAGIHSKQTIQIHDGKL